MSKKFSLPFWIIITFLSSLLMFVSLMNVVPIHKVLAQQIYDVSCPPGTTAINSMANPVNQHLKAYTCVDGSGNVTSPSFQSGIACGPTSTCSNSSFTSLGSTKQLIVVGAAPLVSGTPSTVTITGLPFTASNSFVCTATENTTAANNLIKINPIAANQALITGPNTITDVISYICVGF